MKTDEEKCDVYPNYDETKSYFNTLNKEDIIFEDSSALYEACKIMVSEKFCSESENRDLYLEHMINLYALIQGAQPWYIPAKRNDMPLSIIDEDS